MSEVPDLREVFNVSSTKLYILINYTNNVFDMLGFALILVENILKYKCMLFSCFLPF